MAARALVGYLVGYEGTNIFRIWIPRRRIVIRTRDVTFDELKQYDPRLPFLEEVLTEATPRRQITVEIPHYTPERNTSGSQDSEDSDSETEMDADLPENPTPQITEVEDGEEMDEFFDTTDLAELQQQLPTPGDTPERNLPDAPESVENREPRQKESSEEVHLPRHEISSDVNPRNIIEGSRTRRKRREAYLSEISQPFELMGIRSAYTTAMESGKLRIHRDHLPKEPSNWWQMLKHSYRSQWLDAVKLEYDTLLDLNTFRQVPIPKDNQVVPITWKFVYKFDTDGYLVKFKARLCVRGDLQKLTLDDTYAATLAAKAFRALMAITATFELTAMQWDVTNAFCQAELDEVVYIECPPGHGRPGFCLRLLKPLYGLRRSPRMWYREISGALREFGLTCVQEDMCVFTNQRLVVIFFVDDILPMFHPQNRHKYEEFKEAFGRKYQMRDMGELKWFLGIRVERDQERRKLWLCQDSYIEKIAHRFHLEDRKPPNTPMSTEALVKNEGQATPQEIYLYQQKVGSLLYATTITRPDVAKSASKLSEFLINPSQRHLEAADRAIAYLYGTRHYAMEYGPTSGSNRHQAFECSSDAAFGDHEDRKSSEAYLFSLFGGPIDWRAGKQKTITTSSTEAELLSLSLTAKETYWWKRMFRELGLSLEHEVTIQCDNVQTIGALTKDGGELITKLKHVDIHRHWLRQEVQANKIKITWVPTSQMPADGLTKPLTSQNHEKFVKMLNLQCIKGLISGEG